MTRGRNSPIQFATDEVVGLRLDRPFRPQSRERHSDHTAPGSTPQLVRILLDVADADAANWCSLPEELLARGLHPHERVAILAEASRAVGFEAIFEDDLDCRRFDPGEPVVALHWLLEPDPVRTPQPFALQIEAIDAQLRSHRQRAPRDEEDPCIRGRLLMEKAERHRTALHTLRRTEADLRAEERRRLEDTRAAAERARTLRQQAADRLADLGAAAADDDEYQSLLSAAERADQEAREFSRQYLRAQAEALRAGRQADREQGELASALIEASREFHECRCLDDAIAALVDGMSIRYPAHRLWIVRLDEGGFAAWGRGRRLSRYARLLRRLAELLRLAGHAQEADETNAMASTARRFAALALRRAEEWMNDHDLPAYADQVHADREELEAEIAAGN